MEEENERLEMDTQPGKKTVVLIACSSRKDPAATVARYLYVGITFIFSLEYALKVLNVKDTDIHILSDKYGLLDLNSSVTNYNMDIKHWQVAQRKAWADKVVDALKQKYPVLSDYHFVILAGKQYREFLTPKLPDFCAPLAHYKIGKQISALKKAISTNTPLQ